MIFKSLTPGQEHQRNKVPHDYFCWYPVCLSGKDLGKIAWLETVTRKATGCWDGMVEYRYTRKRK